MRQPLPDLLKGVAIVCMVQVHLMELYATEEVYNSMIGKASLFLGGPFAAPVFMAVMGYFLAASRRSYISRLKRGLWLLGLGLMLNIGMNFHFLARNFHSINTWRYIFGVDILWLAGLSIILITLISLLARNRYYLYFVLALGMAFASPFLRDHHVAGGYLEYITAFFWGSTEWSYFPVIPWLAYPLLGYGSYLLFVEKGHLLQGKEAIVAGISFAVAAVFSPFAFRVASDLPLYYHHGPLFFLWMIPFLALWVIVMHWLRNYGAPNRIERYLRWLGRNVTAVYFVQWLIIGNLAPVFYKSLFLLPLTAWFILVMLATSVIVLLIRLAMNRRSSGLVR